MHFKFPFSRRKSFIAFSLITAGFIIAVFLVLKQREILYEGHPLKYWIQQAEKIGGDERHVAITTLSNILISIHDPGLKANFPFTPAVYFYARKIEKSRNHIRANLPKIIEILDTASTSQRATTRQSAIRGLATIGWWSGSNKLRRVLPTLISGCYDENMEIQVESRRCLIWSLLCFKSFDDYETLPNKDLFPILIEALEIKDLKYRAVVILGYMGKFADQSAIPKLTEVIKSADNRNLRKQAEWAIERIRRTK